MNYFVGQIGLQKILDAAEKYESRIYDTQFPVESGVQ